MNAPESTAPLLFTLVGSFSPLQVAPPALDHNCCCCHRGSLGLCQLGLALRSLQIRPMNLQQPLQCPRRVCPTHADKCAASQQELSSQPLAPDVPQCTQTDHKTSHAEVKLKKSLTTALTANSSFEVAARVDELGNDDRFHSNHAYEDSRLWLWRCSHIAAMDKSIRNANHEEEHGTGVHTC